LPEQAEMRQIGSPGWWLYTLEERLTQRQREIRRYEDYYDGKHRLAFATSKFRDTFGSLFAAFADNWCDLVVDASVERLAVEGFRFGGDQTAAADKEAWAIWQANQLDADSKLAHREAVKCGESYLLVQPDRSGGDMPRITVEHPSQVIVAGAPGDRRVRLAALKKWVDDWDYAMATVYLPGAIHKYQSQAPLKSRSATRIAWVRREGEEAAIRNPLGLVPMVPLLNNPTMLGGGQSDLKKIIPIQDAVNKLVSDMIVASEFAAFRQRWATGIEDTDGDADAAESQAVRDFKAAVSRMWTTANENAHFGEFEASDLGNYVKAIEMLIQHLAAQTRTPPHYLLGQSGAFPSGESLQSTETGLVAKVKDKHIDFGEGHEEAMRLAFKLMGDTERASATDAETIWRDPESRTWGQLVDGLVKLKDLNIPDEILWARAGFTPVEISRMKALQATDELLAGVVGEGLGTPDEQGIPEAV